MKIQISNEIDNETIDKLTQQLIIVEQRVIDKKKNIEKKCDCKKGMFPTHGNVNRRKFLKSAANVVGSIGMTIGMTSSLAKASTQSKNITSSGIDTTKFQGKPVTPETGYGNRSQFETEVRWRYSTATNLSTWTMTPLESGHGIVTPSGLHFERHHGGVPTIHPEHHTLIVHGMVNSPKKYTMTDLKRFPAVSRFYFIECSGNGLTEWRKPILKTVQGTHGLTSTSEWTGVPLSTILNEVGLKGEAAWVLAEGADAAVMTRSVPIDKALDDALIVYGQNGEAIRPEQGYPLRLVLPGYEGNTHIKWLRRLEISDKPFMTREETSKYTDIMKNGISRKFTFTMEAKSVITFPSGEMKLPRPGFYEITGLAWTGRGKVIKVDVSTNGGKSWKTASLDEPVLPICHTRFRLPWQWDGSPAILQSRCHDETGYVQPTIKELADIRGYNSIYHLNGIQSWAVESDGSISNVHHYS